MRRDIAWLLAIIAVVAIGTTFLYQDNASTPEVAETPQVDAAAEPPKPPKKPTPEVLYQMCASNMVRAMAEMEAKYGANGVVPYSETQRISIQFPCPAAGKPTISTTGTGTEAGISMVNFTMFCRDHHHADAGAPEHYPQVHSVHGLVPRQF